MRHLYDSQTASQWTTSPTAGRPAADRTCTALSGSACSGTIWSDELYTYDATWISNRITDKTFTGLGTDAAFATTGAHTLTTTYDVNVHIFPNSTVNDLHQTVLASYDLNWGGPTTITDVAGQSTNYTYDWLGRILSVVRPGDSTQIPTILYQYTDGYNSGGL